MNNDNSIIGEHKFKVSRWQVFGIVFVLSVISILYVDNVVRLNKIYAKIHKIDKKIKALSDENEFLERKLVKLQSPDRIIKIAKEKLGMRKIDESPKLIGRSDD